VADVRARAAIGVVIDGAKGVLIWLLAAGGTVVLARLLSPRDLGLVALGATLVVLTTLLGDGGVGKALVRRADGPEPAELGALLGFQLVLTLILAALALAVTWPFGEVGRVTGVMLLSLPFTALRAPPMILLERHLSYRPIAVAEVTENIVYYGWAVASVLIGFGVWGLASATVARAAVGSIALLILAPAGLVAPLASWGKLRGLFGFGLRYQAVGVAGLARDQAVNAGTAAIAGVAVLGLWSVAYSVLQVPYLLFSSLWRVSFPAMARLVAAGEDLRRTIERSVEFVAVATGVVICPIVAAAPALIPSLLGERWREAAGVLPPAGLGLMVGGSISVATLGYLWAAGDASRPLRATLIGIPPWCGVTFLLLPVLGVTAVGCGWLVGSLVQSLILARAVSRRTRARIGAPLLAPVVIACGSTATGWLVTASAGSSFTDAVLGGGTAEALYLIGLTVLRRRLLFEVVGTTIRAIKASLGFAPAMPLQG
jgi:O-antigen/teichoic acid export membrane protein